MSALLARVDALLGRARDSADVVLAFVMAAIIGSMIVPLPAWLLDAGLALNLAAALALLVAALSAKDALRVASFPTLLLVTTLFRLAMNVSSTRLALSEGHAGEVIQAFGEFVVRGDYVVGAVIFAILTLVQFLVVAKGAERVAEVSARFTLDAMPGKQMSIDADLRAGAISQDQARSRRRALERESQMFGSMDGAMKFVKGDVIAGLVITLVNLVGGTAVGVLQNGQTASEALSTYALISIGDGLVSQIPSLCIAVAAGLVVTRVGSEKEESASLGLDIGTQFFGQWRALLVVAGLCVALGMMPGMPHLTFLLIAGTMTLLALGLRHGAQAADVKSAEASPEVEGVAPEATAAAPGLARTGPEGVSPLILDLAGDLDWLVREDGGRFVTQDLDVVRDRVYTELGVRVPAFRVRVGAPLPVCGWGLAIDELPAGRGQLPAGKLFIPGTMEEHAARGVKGVAVTDPPSGRALVAVDPATREALASQNLQPRHARELLVDQLVGALKKRAASFLGVQEVQSALSALEGQSPALTREATQKVPLPLLTDVLRRLLAEQVSIRNLRAVLEALVAPSAEGDAAQLTERCRQALARQLSWQHASNGPLLAWLVDPAVEETLRQAGPAGGVSPDQAHAIVEGVRKAARQGRAVLLASPDVRRTLRRLVEGTFPEVAVLTFAELDPEVQVRPVGRVMAAARA